MTDPKDEAKALTLHLRLGEMVEAVKAKWSGKHYPHGSAVAETALDLLQQLDAKDARIAELTQRDPDWFDASPEDAFRMLSEARAALEKAEAKIEDQSGTIFAHQQGAAGLAKQRDEARSQLSEATVALVTLREALEESNGCVNDACQATAIYGDQPSRIYLNAISKSQAALSATSHATSAAVERIREKALDAAWERVSNVVEMSPMEWASIKATILNRLNRAEGAHHV